MIRNIVYILLFASFIIFFYITLLFDINDYKNNLEQTISEQANIDFKINGDLSLNLGINTKIRARELSIEKNNIPIFESEELNASVSVSKILIGRFDISSISLKNSKLYGLNIDESIIKTYNLIAGRKYYLDNTMYSNINLIETEGYYQDNILQIKDITINTELLEGKGFGNINPLSESLNISVSTSIKTNDRIKEKYGKYFPEYLVGTKLPVLISGNYSNPQIDIKISEIISIKLKKEIKSKAIKSIKDKIKDKIESEINIILPY